MVNEITTACFLLFVYISSRLRNGQFSTFQCVINSEIQIKTVFSGFLNGEFFQLLFLDESFAFATTEISPFF